MQSNMTANLSLYIRNSTFRAPINGHHADSWESFLTVLPYILVLLSVATNISNLIVLSAFFVNRHLRTPFNCYLVSLVLSDIGQASFDLPFMIVSTFVPVWSLGRVACNFHLYAKWVFSAAVRNTHALISLNRIWALFWPLTYKQYHSKTVAVWLCVGTWVYAHLWLLPGLVPDAMGLRNDDGTCYVNTTAQPIWAITTQMCLYNSTLVVIVITYPLIWWKIHQRQKVMPKWTELNTVNRTAGSTVAKQATASGNFRGPAQTCATVSTAENDKFQDDNDEDAEEQNGNNQNKYAPKASVPTIQCQRKRSQSFAVLTYLVLGVLFCWTPIMVFFTLADFVDYDGTVHFIIGSLLYNFNSLLDPLFFCIAIRPLRETVLSIIGHRAKK